MNAIRHFGTALLLAATGIGPHTHADTYYHWKDAQGNPILSDHPPPDGVTYEVEKTPGAAEYPEVAEEAPDVAEGDEEGDEERKGLADTPTETNAERCARARANLEALGGGDSVTVRNTDGSAHTLSPEEVQIQRETTRAQIKVYCEEE